MTKTIVAFADPKGLEAIQSAQRVLKAEAQAVFELSSAMAGALGQEFSKAVEKILHIKGRVIVTGMGKSGHVARKIAATLASTGTPAQFVHPGEASHGDLGMITESDLVIALSNSGEAPELSDIIAYCKRFSIALVAISGNPEGTLAKSSDIPLIYPKAPEACAIGMAPTTSTTLSMALGDALAVALMEQKGFRAQDFKRFHPGGKLGQQLKKVSDLMHPLSATPLIEQNARMAEAILEMSQKSFGCVGILNEQGHLEGIITDGDLRRHMDPSLMEKPVTQVMTKSPLTISPARAASEALALMNAKSITMLFVTDNNVPAGIVRLHDLLRAGIV